MVNQKHPCARGLTWACFQHDPGWAKRAFSLRLLYTLMPPQVSRLLTHRLRVPLLAAGLIPPAGIDAPPGVVVPPGTVFPPGWTPVDPFPPGALPPPVVPPDMPASGGVSPIYVAPWEPGPINQPGKNPAPLVTTWFNEQCNNFTDNSWVDDSVPTGTVTIDAGTYKFEGSDAAAIARIKRTHATAWPSNWTLRLRVKVTIGGAWVDNWFYTGVYGLKFGLSGTTTAYISSGASYCSVVLSDFADAWHEWKLEVIGAIANLYQDDSVVITGCALNTSALYPGQMILDSRGIAERYYDYMTMA